MGGAAALVMGANAQAAASGFYAGLEAGATWIERSDVLETRNTGATAFHDRIDYDTGWALLATLGYEWNHWRVEGEIGYRQNDMQSLRTTIFTTKGVDNLDQLTLMANVLYDIPLGDRFSATLGAGVGADRISFDWPGFSSNGWSDDNWVFAWQGIVGLNYALSPDCDLFVDYRYLSASGPDYAIDVVTIYTLDFDDVVTHTASVGVRWHFSP